MKTVTHIILLLSLIGAVIGLCDPATDRHCTPFPEKNMTSIGPIVPAPSSPGNSIEENSNGSGGSNTGNGNSNPDSGSGSKTGSGGTNRNSGGTNSNAGSVQVQSTQGIGTAAIVAMSVGGVVLVLAAVAMRRRQLVAGDDAITGIDSLAANTTAEEAA